MNRSVFVSLLAALCALGTGCASSGASDPFVGTYDYTENNTFTIVSPMQAPAMSGTVTGTLTIAASAATSDATDYLVTIDAPGDAGGGACALTASRGDAMSLAFAAGQTCAVSGMGATGTATLTSGSGSLAGATLTLDLAYDITASSPQGSFSATTVDHDTATRR
jgi:hypothetical protein